MFPAANAAGSDAHGTCAFWCLCAREWGDLNLPGTSPAIFAWVIATLLSTTQSRDYGRVYLGPRPKYPSLCNCPKDDYGGLSEEAPRAQHQHSVTLKPVRVSGRIETCIPVSSADSAAVCPA